MATYPYRSRRSNSLLKRVVDLARRQRPSAASASVTPVAAQRKSTGLKAAPLATRHLPAPVWDDPNWRLFTHQDALIANAAWRRGCRVEQFSNSIMLLYRGDERVAWATKVSERTSVFALRVADDKGVAKEFLTSAGLQVPQGAVFSRTQEKKAWGYAKAIGLPVVTKPLGGFGGRGVTTDIRNLRQFQAGWRIAGASHKSIIVEKMIAGADHRIFVIDGRVVAAARRHPAFVTGDGVHSVAQLVEKKNEIRRTIPYVGTKAFVLTAEMLDHLARRGLSAESVPAADEHLQLHPIANVSAGGDSEDATDIIHPGFCEIAVKAAQAIPGLFHAGIDLLAEDISVSPNRQKWAICEINASPDLALHHFPIMGPARDVAGCLVEALFPDALLNSEPDQAARLRFSKVAEQDGENDGFERWFQRMAHFHGVDGWIRNLTEGRSEAVINGPSAAVDEIIRLCHMPSAKAAVDGIERSEGPVELSGRGVWIL